MSMSPAKRRRVFMIEKYCGRSSLDESREADVDAEEAPDGGEDLGYLGGVSLDEVLSRHADGDEDDAYRPQLSAEVGG